MATQKLIYPTECPACGGPVTTISPKDAPIPIFAYCPGCKASVGPTLRKDVTHGH